jgi:Spy/CpxP family protein refolding chaperone
VNDRPRALAVLVTVFLLGAIAGSAGSYYWFSRTANTRASSRRNAPPQVPEHQRLSVLLKLTPDQERRFREIMAEARMKSEPLRIEQDRLWKELQAKQGPQIKAIWDETNSKFSSILNEEQKKEFEAWLEEFRKRPPPPPRGRGGHEPGR